MKRLGTEATLILGIVLSAGLLFSGCGKDSGLTLPTFGEETSAIAASDGQILKEVRVYTVGDKDRALYCTDVYDASGNVIAKRYPSGNEETFEYQNGLLLCSAYFSDSYDKLAFCSYKGDKLVSKTTTIENKIDKTSSSETITYSYNEDGTVHDCVSEFQSSFRVLQRTVYDYEDGLETKETYYDIKENGTEQFLGDTFFKYDDNGNLIYELKTGHAGEHSCSYIYDDEGRLIRKSLVKDLAQTVYEYEYIYE